jgi:hypothetical protein
MGRGCLTLSPPPNIPFAPPSPSLLLHVFLFPSQPVFSTRVFRTYFFPFAHTAYCLGYPDMRSPKIHRSTSVRPPGDERESSVPANRAVVV